MPILQKNKRAPRFHSTKGHTDWGHKSQNPGHWTWREELLDWGCRHRVIAGSSTPRVVFSSSAMRAGGTLWLGVHTGRQYFICWACLSLLTLCLGTGSPPMTLAGRGSEVSRVHSASPRHGPLASRHCPWPGLAACAWPPPLQAH